MPCSPNTADWIVLRVRTSSGTVFPSMQMHHHPSSLPIILKRLGGSSKPKLRLLKRLNAHVEPTTKFLHKIEWPNHMNSWESGLAFSLSFCSVSLQTSGDSSWQKQFSFFLFISQSFPFVGSLLLVLWGPPQIAADCRRVNDFCTRHDWDVTTGGDGAVLLKANSLLCSHSHRDHRFCIYILPHHPQQRSVDNTCFRAFDWLNNTLNTK